MKILSTQLKKTLDILEDDLQSLKGRTAGRERSNAETRAIQVREDEVKATRELYNQACTEEDAEHRAARDEAFRGFTPEAIASINVQMQNPNATAEERAQKIAEVLAAPAPGGQIEAQATGRRRSFFPSLHLGSGTGDPARRTIDQAHKRGLLPADAADIAERLVTSGADESRSLASRWVQATGADKYMAAFLKVLADPTRGHMLWTEEERKAYQVVDQVRTELRGMTTGAGSGGELLPLVLDPAILLTSEGSNNPLRRNARVVQTTAGQWQGVTSAGVTAEWKAETVEASDATPTTAPAPIPVFFGDAYVEYSYEIEQDGYAFASQLATLLMDAADQLQAAAFTTGAGLTQPTGFVTALAGTASELSPEVAETFGSPDVYKVQNALPARFQAQAQWMAGLPTINKIAQFESTNGARLFPEVADGKLLRRPLSECSNMQDTNDIDAAGTEDNLILCYGDWNQFVIVDRIGTQIEIVPQVIGENRRPTGQRGAFLWFRTGSNIVVPQAFRILNVATSAIS